MNGSDATALLKMTYDERQHYIAYGASSDEFEIKFFGGPLDGSRIRTDILPDSEAFCHRVNGRRYFYEYHRVSKELFHATLHSTEPID